MGERQRGISRRKSLGYIGISALAVLAPVLFSKYQEGKDYSVVTPEIIDRLKRYQNKKFSIGLYPDRENFSDNEALQRVDKFREIAEIDVVNVGIFITSDQFMDSKFCDEILIPWMWEVDTRGGKNILSVTSYRKGNWMGHPLLPQNLPIWKEGIYQAEENLRPFAKPFYLRPWFEANTFFESEDFSYNLHGGISQDQHQESYFWLFDTTAQAFEASQHEVILVPSLWPEENFTDYILPPEEYLDYEYVTYVIGPEGYNYFVPLREVNELGDVPPFLRGNLTPQEVYSKNLAFLENHLAGLVGFRVTEGNSAYEARRDEWIFNAMLLARAYGANGFDIFDYDKSDRKRWPPPETRWTTNRESIVAAGRAHKISFNPELLEEAFVTF